ncbi:YscB family type III secretion system chaperone (plasmid) [Photobacterium damselae subsp. piscicida]|uniref:YscB family type III secretion system chaperone n=1 Tax=Photobacterium damsela subsp. piscicida TaxID=38294 RepID=A0A1V1VH30_PHODP|nr:YscB family type III secretion system chaperone [Photobacterium damselae]MBE8130527.1 YscB family type III secretion system chaperone [Photobacterium damselae subsp. piscicida]MDP2534267.1 YscB family type III secretion system chaperone [Photobacterium damselae subsp. piscicida]MDP2543362.1 YscB family type III secretion system chaperone [Photobacterium damselae subsp. piscicida]QOD55154.1 YscB family type III secretion system chaperone [Photobacterium damselae subsp. piscicida]QOD58980.1 Y
MLDQMMKSLAATLGLGDFISSNNGSYDIEVDQILLNIRQHSSWVLWETVLPFQFKQHLDYQKEQTLKHCMQLSLKTLRDTCSTLTVNNNEQLIVQGKMNMESATTEALCAQLSQHVNLVEQFSDVLERQRVNHTVSHCIWIP